MVEIYSLSRFVTPLIIVLSARTLSSLFFSCIDCLKLRISTIQDNTIRHSKSSCLKGFL